MNIQQFEALSEKEKAVWLGHKLHLCSLDTQREWQEYHEWLSSPDGLDAIELAMIAMGYDVRMLYRTMPKDKNQRWRYHFGTKFCNAPTKPQAIITAAAKALIAEEER